MQNTVYHEKKKRMAKKDAKDRDGKTVRRKIIPEDVGDSEQLILDVYSSVGLGKLNIYECNQILVDPDRRDDKLQDYEYEPDLRVVLSLVEAYSFEKNGVYQILTRKCYQVQDSKSMLKRAIQVN